VAGHRQQTDTPKAQRVEGGGFRRWKEVCEGRNSNRRERLKRRKTNDFNMKKTDVVIIYKITLKCIDPSITKMFRQIVHRRTYKELLSSPFIEKCIFQFDP